MSDRRTFLKKVAATISLVGLSSYSLKAQKSMKPLSNILIHHVYFWLKNPEDSKTREQFEKALKKLVTIDEIKNFHLGVPASTEERDVVDHSYSYSLMVIFNSKKDQDIYQKHPIHLDFVKHNEQLWENVKVFDSVDMKP
ncbi:Dabb family protein [Marinilabilia sp.]|uniref:Dabb family protein n=1 Tax=Marinilabilia sp. TaxID=2021252 RepID=UPI0025BD5929|nr:Dabb family protein [Marinilabilia sp.]